MKHLIFFLFVSLFIGLLRSLSAQSASPNVVIILADDLGFSDLGCYGGEIETPNLDQLAEDGLRFTQFYNTGRCWPTRGALLTGYYAQQISRDKFPGVKKGGAGTKRPAWARLLPDMLKQQNYRAYHSGKWHIDGMPLENGFDKSYYLRDQGRFFNPQRHYLDDKELPEVKAGTDYYGTTAIADHAIECLQEQEKYHADRPFFHFIAFTAPHFPLHARQEDIDKYADHYLKDWEKLRVKRFKRQRKMGIIQADLSEVERHVGPPYTFDNLGILGPGEVHRPLPWKSLSKEQQRFQATKMSIHAAMIDRMDQEIGRIIGQLKNMGAFENTLILFLSDNGASAEIMVRDDGHDPEAAPGSAATYLCLGPGFSTMANTPFRRHKTWVHEGGISTPLLVHWPRGISDKGSLRHHPGHVIDIVPTILEVAAASPFEVWEGKPGIDPPGHSLLAAIRDDQAVSRTSLWWLHEGNRAIRVGDWKLVAAKGEAWELFDLSQDRAETHNLATERPGKLKELAAQWEAQTTSFQELAEKNTQN
ncbi:MAG: arylsulfatase [Bacteroidota bacterium]